MGKTRNGYTLLEMVATLAVLGVLLGLAAPRMEAYLAGLRTRAALNTLAVDLAYTRALALRHGQRAVLVFRHAEGCPEPRPGAFAAREYVIVVPGDPLTPPRRVSLARDLPRTCLEVRGSDTLGFNSRGLLLPIANRKVRALSGGRADSLTISSIGRVYRRF